MIDVPVQVKDALREGDRKKNYRIIVLATDTEEQLVIDNDTLVKESVQIDERMVSGDTLKFGLCEGSSLEFQYFDHPNITGRRLQVFIDVEYGASSPCTIPMGYFDVKKCSRQASTGIIKVTAYNKLQSDYLDQKANQMIADNIEDEDHTGSMSLYSLLSKLLEDYTIDFRVPQLMRSNVIVTPTGTGGYSANIKLYAGDTPWSSLIGNDLWLHIVVAADYSPWEDTLGYCSKTVAENLANKITDSWDAFLTNESDYYYQYYSRSTIPLSDSDGTTIYPLLKNIVTTTSFDDINNNNFLEISQIKGAMYWKLKTSEYPVDYSEVIYGIFDYNLNNLTLPFHYNGMEQMLLRYPTAIWVDSTQTPSQATRQAKKLEWETDFVNNYSGLLSYDYKKDLTPMEEYRVVISDFTTDVTLRDLQSAVFETACQFGQLSRETDLFSGVELNHSRLLPAETLYPDTELYPGGAAESAFRGQYSKLWADEGNIRKWRYLIITYKGLDENDQEADFTLQRTVNADGTDDYNMSDNWLFRNLVWTAAQVGDYADAMVEKMQDITWFPFEMWAAGLPYLETGDEIEIPLGEETYTSYILQRQLKGIQNLQDTYINGTLDIF